MRTVIKSSEAAFQDGAKMPHRKRMSPVQVEIRWEGVVATVTATGELDSTTAPAVAEALQKIVADRPERLVLDLRGLVFLDTAGAAVLDQARAALAPECPVILRRPRPSARAVLQLSGLGLSAGG
jgi:anti-anti-sigma factor